MGADEIHDDRTAGASELARRAVALLAETARSASGMGRVRDEQARLAGLRPSMAAIEGALAIYVAELEELAASGRPWEAAAREARAAALERLDAVRSGVVRHAVAVLGRASPERVVTISCSSTVRAVLEARPVEALLVSEGRPGLEGRAIAEGFASGACRVELCTDGALPGLLARGDLVLVGADAVEADGHLVNKVGTFALALAARRLGVPFHAACERFKFSRRSGLGLEAKEGGEVWPDAPSGVVALNPYFERTPPDLVTGFITDTGVLAWSPDGFVPRGGTG